MFEIIVSIKIFIENARDQFRQYTNDLQIILIISNIYKTTFIENSIG